MPTSTQSYAPLSILHIKHLIKLHVLNKCSNIQNKVESYTIYAWHSLYQNTFVHVLNADHCSEDFMFCVRIMLIKVLYHGHQRGISGPSKQFTRHTG